MTWRDDGDGWRNEDDEGPYIDVLRTKGNWEIFRGIPGYRHNIKYTLKNVKENFRQEFDSIIEAKQYVKDHEELI